jgi:WD40 repeat protein
MNGKRVALSALLLVSLLSSACSQGSRPAAPPTAVPSTTPNPTPTATFTATFTATATPIPPTPTLPPQFNSAGEDQFAFIMDLESLPGAGEACAAAFQAGAPASAVLPGKVLMVSRRTFVDDSLSGALVDTTWGVGKLVGASPALPLYTAHSLAEVSALVCIEESRVQVATYYPASQFAVVQTAPAWQLNWNVRIITWPEGKALAGRAFTGEMPPETIDFGSLHSGVNYGTSPAKALQDWIMNNPLSGTPTPLPGESAGLPEGIPRLFSPDGTRLVITDETRSPVNVSLFNLAQGKVDLTVELPEKLGTIRSLGFSGDGSGLIIAADYNLLRINLANGSLQHNYPPDLNSQAAYIFPAFISADGSTVAAQVGNEIVIWDSATGAAHTILEGRQLRYDGTAISGDGRILVYAGSNCETEGSFRRLCRSRPLTAVDTTNGAEIGKTEVMSYDFDLPLFVPGSSRVVVHTCTLADARGYCEDNWLALWDARAGESLEPVKLRWQIIKAMFMQPDGKLEVTGSPYPDDSAKGDYTEIWDMHSLSVVGYRAAEDHRILLVSPDGKWTVYSIDATIYKLVKN